MLDSFRARVEASKQELLPILAPFAAEFLGTFIIAVCHGCTVASDPLAGWWPTAVGFGTMGVMYGTFAVSGGHLNPGLSLAFCLAGRLDYSTFVGYAFVQGLAGLLGGAVAALIQGGTNFSTGTVQGGLTALVVEAVYCTAIFFVALSCTDADGRTGPKQRSRNQYFALAVGFAILAAGYACASISLSLFNPGVTLASVVLGRTGKLFGGLLAMVQFAAAVPATTLAALLRPVERRPAAAAAAEAAPFAAPLAAAPAPASPPPQPSPSAAAGEGSSPAPALPPPSADAAAAAWASGLASASWEESKPALPTRLMGEYLGTFICVLTFRLVMLSEKARYASVVTTTLRPDAQATRIPAGSAGWAEGAMLLSMVYSLCAVSGSHLNPAVTLASVCSGVQGQGPTEALLYGSVQMIGGVTAGLASAVVGIEFAHEYEATAGPGAVAFASTSAAAMGAESGYGGLVLGPGEGISWNVAGVAELVFTAALALVVLCVTSVRSPRYPKAPGPRSFNFGLAVGLCLASGSYALDRISGGVLNPAAAVAAVVETYIDSEVEESPISLGLALADYSAWQLTGGFIAAVLFAALHPLLYKKDPLLPAAAG